MGPERMFGGTRKLSTDQIQMDKIVLNFLNDFLEFLLLKLWIVSYFF